MPTGDDEWQKEKNAYIQRYLVQTRDIDSQSITTEPSDSGMSGSSGYAPSELGRIEEPSGKYV